MTHAPHVDTPAEESATALGSWAQALRDGWALARPFWRDPAERRALGLLAAVVGLTLGTVALNVRFSSWNSAFYDALQNHDLPTFWHQLRIFGGLAAAFIVSAVYRQYLQQQLEMRWRVWLSRALLSQWLRPGTAYRLGSAYRAPHLTQPDNPDQRIAEDTQQFVSGCLSLSLGLLNATVTLVSFVSILWGLSGALSIDWSGHVFTLQGDMVWVALAYAAVGSWLTHRIGRPLVGLGIQQQRAEADLRYALVQVRDHAEAIALARGESAEGTRLDAKLEGVRANWWRLIGATKRLTWFSSGYGQLAVVFPLLAAAPRYFAGRMALGGLMQTAQAFGQVQGALSWFIDAYGSLADWRATVQRLAVFQRALARDSAPHPEPMAPPVAEAAPGLALALQGLQVQTPDGQALVRVPEASIADGARVLVTGPSGRGKSALLRTLAGLWPQAGGQIQVRRGQRWMFVPQRPYLPPGSLAQALAWPRPASTFSEARLRSALNKVGLSLLDDRLAQVADWGRQLSPGEQQRLQFARMLLHHPDVLVLDEVSAALDPDAQQSLYALVLAELPRCTVLSVAHRPELAALHDTQWRVQHGQLDVHAPQPGSVARLPPASAREGRPGSALGA